MKTYEINEENLKAICGFVPFEIMSPNNTPMLGVEFDYISLNIPPANAEEEKGYYLFLQKSWPFQLGLRLIWFGIRNFVRNLTVRRAKNA